METRRELHIRNRVIQLFEMHRATPGAPFDESHFLDFLLADPKAKGAIRNSFRGLRRFNLFLDEVQLELGVCFSIRDREANYPLDKFVARTLQLQQSRRSSLTSLQNQMKAGPGWTVLIVADFALLVLAGLARDNVWALVVIAVVATAANVSFLLFALRQRTYNLKLLQRLKSD